VPSPILASSFFVLLVTPGLAQDLSSRLSRISGPVRHAGTYHVATGTWTRGVPLAALTGPDTIFDNTCRASYFAPQASGEKWQTRQVLPSPTRPYSPCAPPQQQAPGCQTSYEINGFEIAYCSSHPSTVDWLVEFADLFTFCATADMIPTRSFPLPGLPGGTPGGALNCWVVDVDLSATTPSFVLQADGSSIYHSGDTALFSDMALIQRLYRPKTGLICIGDRFTMGPESAAIACNEFLDLDLIVPIHWGTFGLLSGEPEDFARRVTRGRVHVATPGEPFEG